MSAFDPLHLLAYVGIASLLLFFLPTPLLSLYRYFLRPARQLRQYGQYAVITGATDGIGKAFAFAFIRQNLSLLLISRSPQRLAETEADLRKKYPKANIRSHAVDFSDFSTPHQTELQSVLSSLDIGLLVNNVGMSYPHPDFYHELSSHTLQQLIDLNVKAAALMTSLVLPGMLKKRKGAVVNIASFAAILPSPLLSQYAATKAYMVNLTTSLSREYSGKGIRFQVQCPSFVTSKLSKIRQPSLMVPSPSTYVNAAVKAIGYETVSIPYWPHAVQYAVSRLLPESVVAWYIMRVHQDLRKRALKKKEKQQDGVKSQ